MNPVDELQSLLKQLGASDDHIKQTVDAASPKWIAQHVEDLKKILSSFQARRVEDPVRTLTPELVHLAPPYLLARLKLSLANFNAKTMTWRKP